MRIRRSSWACWALSAVASLLLLAPIGANAQTKISIGSSVQSLFSLPLYVAHSKGFFKDEGLDVEVINFRGGATATPALIGGSVQFQSAATENLLKLVNRNQPVVSLMTVQSTLNGAIVVREELQKKLGRKPTLKDLKGLRLGTLARGGMADMAARYIIADLGLAESDVELIPLAGYDRHIAALKVGDIDATFTVEPVQTMLVDQVGGHVLLADLLHGDGPALFQDMHWITLQAKSDYVAANRDIADKVVKSMVRAQNFIADPANLDAVTEEARKAFPDMPLNVLKNSIKNQLHTYRPEVTKAGIDKNNELLVKTGQLPAPVPFEKVVDQSFAPLWKEFKAP